MLKKTKTFLRTQSGRGVHEYFLGGLNSRPFGELLSVQRASSERANAAFPEIDLSSYRNASIVHTIKPLLCRTQCSAVLHAQQNEHILYAIHLPFYTHILAQCVPVIPAWIQPSTPKSY